MRRHWKTRVLLLSTGFVIALAVAYVSVRAAQTTQMPLAGSAIPQFAQPLPVLGLPGTPSPTIAVAYGSQALTIRMCEFWANVLPPGTLAVGVTPKTRVWGYVEGACPANGPNDPARDTYLGPVILNQRDVATPITFINELGSAATTGVLAYKYSTDQTLDWADPLNNELNACNNAAGGIPSAACAENYLDAIPAAVHLHGGEVPPELDGGPDSWFTSDGLHVGNGYYTKDILIPKPLNTAIYRYPNKQEASPIWFHDHVKGATRLNVYAGLAGGYLVMDPSLNLPAGLHAAGLSYSANNATLDVPTVPLIIQDRMFDTNGQLFFPADTAGGVLWSVNPEHPYWVPEFLGDTIVVNGKAWPYFDVEPKRYRFLFLNGSNARTYEMFLVNPITKVMGPSFSVIATDGGYLQTPVTIDPNAATNNVLVMMPGERYEVIIDFSTVAPGTNLILRNNARSPYPKGAAPNGQTTGRIMQFRVGFCTSNKCGATDTSFVPTPGTPIRPATGLNSLVRLVNPTTGTLADNVTVAKTRQLTLNEVMGMPQTVTDPVTGVPLTPYPGGPLEILVNNTKLSGESPRLGIYNDFIPVTEPIAFPAGNTFPSITTYVSEDPQEGTTEVWEIVNLTADAHPMHLHLVQFQIMNRQNFNTIAYPAAYAAAFPAATGCTAGFYCPGFGPPYDYSPTLNPLSGGKWGGNPDVGAVGKTGKPLYLQGPIMLPKPWEAGWKDTIMVPPGQVTRIVVRWAPTSEPLDSANLFFPFDPSGGGLNSGPGYVWHCHIIDHEDNEMMRPDKVRVLPNTPRTYVKGNHY